jgi:dihydrodipicolinate synthase/N-acetylneuraminate lyase
MSFIVNDDLFSGIFVPVLTPLNPDLSVNVESLEDHINDMIKNGCKGVVIFGSTGESAKKKGCLKEF